VPAARLESVHAIERQAQRMKKQLEQLAHEQRLLASAGRLRRSQLAGKQLAEREG